MSGIQTCLASFVVMAGAQSTSDDLVDQQIEAYLGPIAADRVQALADLKTAFEEMRLDGRVAGYISSRIELAMASARATNLVAGADRFAPPATASS